MTHHSSNSLMARTSRPGTKPRRVQKLTLPHTGLALSSSNQLVAFNTVNALLVEEQTAHQATQRKLDAALRQLANFQANTEDVVERMEKAEDELSRIICPFHGWKCNSRDTCSQTGREKYEEQKKEIKDLRGILRRVNERCEEGHTHEDFYQS